MPKLASILILHNFSMFPNFQDQPEKKMKIVWASSESWNWLNGWNHICLLKNFFNETKKNATATNFLKFVKSWLIIETRLAKDSRILWMKCSMRHLMKQGTVFFISHKIKNSRHKKLAINNYEVAITKILPLLVVNFIHILQSAFAPIFLHQKITKQNCN